MSDIQNQHDVVYKSENTQKLKEEDTLKVDKVVDVEHVTETCILCRTCKQNFLSKNKLHLHLHAECQKQLKIQKPEPLKNMSTFIKFTAKEKTSRAMGLEVEDMPQL
jgi:Fe-S oxidoreductase